MPATGALARGLREKTTAPIYRSGLLGQAARRIRRCQSAGVDRRFGAGGSWRQSHRSDVYRRPQRRLALRRAARGQLPPPANNPNPIEFNRCRSYLIEELWLFRNLKVVIVLGKIAFDSFLAAYRETGGALPKPRPRFGHGAAFQLAGGLRLICSYHPSQQNTFTGKLTRPMFRSVFAAASASLPA